MLLNKLIKLRHPEIWRKNISAFGWYARERWWDLVEPASEPPLFVIGCSRSGTTVTYETLCAAEELVGFGHELPQFWDATFGPHTNNWDSEAATEKDADPKYRNQFLGYCYARLGHGKIIDKTCINILRIPFLQKLFPEASFVYIHRDGRENISSLIDGWRDGRFGLNQFLGPAPDPVQIDDGKFSQWHFFLPPGWRNYNRSTLPEVCAYQWIVANELALEAKQRIDPERWVEIRYEDIVENPYELFESVYAKLNLKFSANIQNICASLNDKPTSMVTGPPSRKKWVQRNSAEIENIIPRITPLMTSLGRKIV